MSRLLFMWSDGKASIPLLSYPVSSEILGDTQTTASGLIYFREKKIAKFLLSDNVSKSKKPLVYRKIG
jgi:hypothetical protein